MTNREPQLINPKYRPYIDGLRAIAVLSVVTFHAFPQWLSGGFIGVDIFFVISGFLITTIILENLEKGTFSFREFYSRRIKRIFPALVLVLTASLIFGWFALLDDEYKQLGKHVAASAGFIANFILWSEVGYFDNNADTKPMLHLWSLGVEEQFYIVWPALLWLCYKQKKNAFWLTIFLVITSFYLNLSMIRSDAAAAFYFPHARFWEILSGGLLAFTFQCQEKSASSPALKIKNYIVRCFKAELFAAAVRIPPNVVSLLGLSLICFSFVFIKQDFNFWGMWALLPIVGTVMLIYVGANAWTNRVLLSNRILVWFGLISYPLYLWHWPLLSFARIIESGTPSVAIRIIAILTSIILAWLTYRLVEKPIRSQGYNKSKLSILVTTMLVIGSAGYYIYIKDGISSRKAEQEVSEYYPKPKYRLRRSQGWLCEKQKFANIKCFVEGQKPSVVVLGDSHANSIFWGLRELYKSRGIGIALLGGAGGCPPLFNVISKDSPGEDDRHCLENASEPLKAVLEDSDVKEVILAGRWSIYITSRGFGEHEIGRFDHWVLSYPNEQESQKSNREVFEMALDDTITKLHASGKKIIFLYDVPEIDFVTSSCVPRPITITKNVRSPCAVSKERFEQRNKGPRQLIGRVLNKHPYVRVIDLSTALCDEKYCYGGIGKNLFYVDENHLSHVGSSYVANKLSNKFFVGQ